MSMIAPSLRKSPASSRGASIFLLFLVCSVLGVAAPALVASENGSVVEPPLGPLIYENAENQKLSLIWFHSSLNRRALGNITTFQPLRYVAPRMSDDRAVVASVFEQGTPVAVHRISTLLSPVDVFPDLPGDQFNALDALIGMSRDDMLLGAHSHSIARLDSGNSNPRIDIFPGQIIEGGDSLFVGLRWAAGFPVSPQVGAQEGLGAIASQYIGYERPPDAIWVRSPDNYSLEVELLDWRPGPTINARGVTAFETWYAADSLSGPSEAIMSALITSDTLLWETPVIQDGYLSVAAVNPGGERSEPIRASIRVSEFSNLRVRPASPEFDWRLPGSRSQWIKIDNLSRQTVTVRFAVEWARLVVEPSLLTLGEFESDSTLMTLRNSPNSTAAEPFSVFIYNNRGWAPLLVGALALPDFQTSVGDDDPTLPASFSLSDVYPNPSRGTSHLRLNSPVSRRFTVVVFNVLGQALQSQQVQVLGETEIMVELESTSEFPLAAGIYFIRVSSDSESLMRKFVLVK